MFAFATLVALASAALPNVLAHGGVLSYGIEGQIYQGWKVSTMYPALRLLYSTIPPLSPEDRVHGTSISIRS